MATIALAAERAAASTFIMVSLLTRVNLWWRVFDAVSNRYCLTLVGLISSALMALSKDYFTPEAALQEDISCGGVLVVIHEILPVAGILVCHGLKTETNGSEVE